jgi:hypothetical protein
MSNMFSVLVNISIINIIGLVLLTAVIVNSAVCCTHKNREAERQIA